MNLEYSLLNESSKDGAVRCISESFFKNDLLGVELGISFNDWINFSSGAVDKSIKDKVSFVALDGKAVVGANLCYNFENYSPEDYNTIKSFFPISSFMDTIYEDYDVSGKGLHFSYIGVVSNYLRKNVAFEMANRNINFAREKNYDKIILEATSPYSQRNAVKLGFKKVNEVFYKDFEYKGKKVFNGIKDAPSCILMELKL